MGFQQKILSLKLLDLPQFPKLACQDLSTSFYYFLDQKLIPTLAERVERRNVNQPKTQEL